MDVKARTPDQQADKQRDRSTPVRPDSNRSAVPSTNRERDKPLIVTGERPPREHAMKDTSSAPPRHAQRIEDTLQPVEESEASTDGIVPDSANEEPQQPTPFTVGLGHDEGRPLSRGEARRRDPVREVRARGRWL
jgi:hypothetical protein